MTNELNKPADLTLWPTNAPVKSAACLPQPTLLEALRLAGEAIENGAARPWIITDAGDILTPTWIAAHGARLLAGRVEVEPLAMAA